MEEDQGILLIDKPAGWTSFDVVAKVRGQLKKQFGHKVKVGHAGTLDPFATGLLILAYGKATKQIDQFMKLDKVYEVTARLGYVSSTGDPEGDISKIEDRRPEIEEVAEALKTFLGEISQVPPAYSAIKVNGQRAYDLARAGKAVELKPRMVKIYEITNVEYIYPELKFTTKVSSGTYIRSLVSDLGERLGTGAYCIALRRTQIGEYSAEKADSIQQIEDATIASS